MGDDVRYQDINTMNEHLPDDLLGHVEEPIWHGGCQSAEWSEMNLHDEPYPPWPLWSLAMAFIHQREDHQHAHNPLHNLLARPA